MGWFRRSEPEIETREAQPFTDAVVAAIVAAAEGVTPGDPGAIAALECAAGLYARAFAGAVVSPASAAQVVTPKVRALIARDLIRRGESVHLIDINNGMLEMLPCGSWDVRGGWRENSWWYRVDTFGPSGNDTHFVPADAVVHARYAVDPARPWYGISPLGWARATGALAANLEQRLGEEAGAPVAHVLPIPQDPGGDDDPLAQMRLDLANAKGRTILTETTSQGWGEGRASAPQRDWQTARIGADPPTTVATLRSDTAMAVLDACGVPRALAESADGTAAREGWRRFVMGAVEPVAELVAEELQVKLDIDGVRFDFSGLWAHDLQGRAASFKALVTAGMAVTEAAAASGLLVDDDA